MWSLEQDCCPSHYHWGQNHYIPFKLNVCLGEIFSVIFTGNLTEWYLGGITYCNVTGGVVLPCEARIFRLQLQFLAPCCVGIDNCNVIPILYRYLSFQNTICNNVVHNGMRAGACLNLWLQHRATKVEHSAGVIHRVGWDLASPRLTSSYSRASIRGQKIGGLSAPKSREPLRSRLRFFTAPRNT